VFEDGMEELEFVLVLFEVDVEELLDKSFCEV
jgi:hypothetical protein